MHDYWVQKKKLSTSPPTTHGGTFEMIPVNYWAQLCNRFSNGTHMKLLIWRKPSSSLFQFSISWGSLRNLGCLKHCWFSFTPPSLSQLLHLPSLSGICTSNINYNVQFDVLKRSLAASSRVLRICTLRGWGKGSSHPGHSCFQRLPSQRRPSVKALKTPHSFSLVHYTFYIPLF